MSDKTAKKKYEKPTMKSEKLGSGTLTAGGPGGGGGPAPGPAPTCNGMPGSGKKATPAACTYIFS